MQGERGNFDGESLFTLEGNVRAHMPITRTVNRMIYFYTNESDVAPAFKLRVGSPRAIEKRRQVTKHREAEKSPKSNSAREDKINSTNSELDLRIQADHSKE